MLELWAVLEYPDGVLSEADSELLLDLAEIARRQQKPTRLCVVLLIPPGMSLEESHFSRFDVQEVYVLEHPLLGQYTMEGYISALTWLMYQFSPVLIAATASARGRDWVPRLGARLRLPFIPGCLGLDIAS